MQLPSIGTQKHAEHVKRQLDSAFQAFCAEGVDIHLQERSCGKMHFLDLVTVDGDTSAPAALTKKVRGQVATALSEVILDHLEEEIARRIVHEGYNHFPRDEYSSLLESVTEELHGEGKGYGLVDRSSRRLFVAQHLKEYLETHDQVNLEGFVRFRLKEYTGEIEEAVDRAVDSYMMEKEYGEFIRLLRYFVETQEPRADEVNVIVSADGQFWLADAQGQKVKSSHLDELVIEMVDGDIEYEDVLMSNLITMAPSSVVIHRPEGGEIPGTYIETIKSVFGDRVKTCFGCSLCGHSARKKGF
ncbi:MAG: putative sporulation protein YtxC [Bacillota bacterium]|nr:putative sporulation protein YtxC [Bacillota bacterium]